MIFKSSTSKGIVTISKNGIVRSPILISKNNRDTYKGLRDTLYKPLVKSFLELFFQGLGSILNLKK